MSTAPPQLVFLLEEATKEEFLKEFLPRVEIPEEVDIVYRVAEGHDDLRKNIPKFMNAWGGYDRKCLRFMVFCDQDSAACKARKDDLALAVPEYWRQQTVIRIVCREMEGWYLGDGQSLMAVLPAFAGRKARELLAREPDQVKRPAEAIGSVAPFRKTRLARDMGASVRVEENRSGSFSQFLVGLQRLTEELKV